jgi:hypothetical protein
MRAIVALENSDNNNNIPKDKPYPKLSKASSGYLEIEQFKNSDLHTGYFCYNCTYFIKDNHCAIVEDSGPDVNARVWNYSTVWSLYPMGS